MPREFPQYPVLAVGAVVFNTDEVLLVRRGKEPGRGLWSIPGGAVRLGERLEEAVQREIEEETGLSIEPVCPIKVVERILPQNGRIRYHYVIIDYACTCGGGTPKPGSDADEARWIPWSSVRSLGLSEETLAVLELGRQILKDQTPG